MLFKDQMLREVPLEDSPQRIISLVPSQTELLHDLGLGERVVGITKFCLHPDAWYRGKHRIGGTKSVNFDKVRDLNPDLIIGNKEENERSDIESLEESYPLWMSDIFNLQDALQMIQSVGELTDTKMKAEELIQRIEAEFDAFDTWVEENVHDRPSVAYFIWKDPDYCAGRNTFIDAMIERCGLQNYMNSERYPEFEMNGEEVPDYIFLSSEPFPFKNKHIENFRKKFPNSKVVLVDGEMFSWYGSRLTLAPAYFKSLLQELASN
ncbi:MAG: helical backbone metal receptor [Crocinitomicaceae bacterium]